MNTALKKEPAVIISTVTAFATAVIGLLVAFNINVTQAQQDAIVTVISATSGVIFLLGPIIRQFVFSPASTKEAAATAADTGVVPAEVRKA